jgi:sigma-B regulation protein RsbU (phosphoserine phosphatase)
MGKMKKDDSLNNPPLFGSSKRLLDRIYSTENNWFVEIWESKFFFLGIEVYKTQKETVKAVRKSDFTMSNDSFSFLKGSAEFLDIVINNINSCVLLLDKDLRLIAFNDALKTIFSNKNDESLFYIKCGEAIGCAYQVEEQKECGQTSRCIYCELKISALKSYLNNEVIYKQHISRPFFNSNNQKVTKELQFSTRLFVFNNEKFIIMLIEDITKLYQGKENKNFS